jgi:hypothetical protein
MKKTLFILFLLLGLYFNYALAENATGTLRLEKTVLIPADRQCFYFEFPNVQIPLTGFFEAQLFTFGPNNRGCQNGCSIQASRYLWTNSAIACFNTSFLPEDSGNWSAYVVYQGQKTNEVRYTVQSSANSTSSALVSNNLNITLDLKANGTTNLSVYPGNMIKYTWYVDGKDVNFSQYELVSWYTADKPDSCPGGITKANEPKPWIITPTSYSAGENVAKVEECQAGVNYKITFAYRNRSNGSVVAQTSINVSVGSKNNASGAYNPPSDFCSKIESGKTYSYNQLIQILQPYADSDKASCNLQQKYLYSGIPYSKTGDGSNIPPGVLYKADNYSIYYVGSGDALMPIRILDGTTFLCSHFDNDLFSSLGFGPYPICSGGSKEFNMIDTCAQPANSTFIKNKIMSLCNKNINVYELSDYLPRELSNINQGSASSASTGQARGQTSGQSLGQTSGQSLGQTSGQATQTNTLNQFRPTDVYIYSGPTTLAGERISTNIQSNTNQSNQTNVSGLNSSSQNNSNNINQVLTSLNSVSSLLKTIEDSNLSEEVKQQLLTLLQSVINSITDLIKKITGLITSNNFNQNQTSVQGSNLANLKASYGDYFTKGTWFESITSTAPLSNVYFQWTLPENQIYVAYIWCNQNSTTTDPSQLPKPDFDFISRYVGDPVIIADPARSCKYTNPGNYYLKLIVGQPDISSNSKIYQDIVPITVAGTSTSATTTSTAKIIQKLTSIPKARYIKDEIKKSGWVAIREMEVYDKDGNKIQIINANSSCDWCGYGNPPFYAVGAKGVFDNYWGTVWNAGETAPNCNWFIPHLRDDGIYGVGCSPSAIRSAWINVDLGKTYEIGKIRIHVMGDSTDRVDKISVSTDGTNYQTVCELKASKENPLVDRWQDGDWIECSIW